MSVSGSSHLDFIFRFKLEDCFDFTFDLFLKDYLDLNLIYILRAYQ